MKAELVVTFLLIVAYADCTPCSRVESVNITSGEGFPNGSMIHDGVEYRNNAWYEAVEDGQLIRLGCPCIGRVCLWKCCGQSSMFVGRTCDSATGMEDVNPFSPPVFRGREPVDVVAHEHFFYMYNRLCEDRYLLDTLSSREEIFIQENATLFELSVNRPQWHGPTVYCADMMVTNMSLPPRLVALVCLPDTAPGEDSPILYIAYAVGLLLSVPFLLATFLVYAFISELRNLHGMCLMAYCAGLIVAYPLLAYLKISVGEVGVFRTGCLVLAFIIYYAFQTSFFWLNVMCIDIWRTFSGYRGGSSNKRRDRRRFALYGLYAWGVPLVLTSITAGMQFAYDLPEHIIRPNFAHMRCWFEDWLSELVYFFTPVLVLVVCNVVLFSVTAHRIRSIRQETAILKGAESSRSDKLKRDKQRYALYLKLFMVMGVNWTVELISFGAGGSNWYWILIDLANIGLGVFIFFIFVWKNKVRNLVRKKILVEALESTSKRLKIESDDQRAAGGVNKWRGVTSDPRAPLTETNNTGRWASRSSSAPTEVTRVSSVTDDPAVRLRDMH